MPGHVGRLHRRDDHGLRAGQLTPAPSRRADSSGTSPIGLVTSRSSATRFPARAAAGKRVARAVEPPRELARAALSQQETDHLRAGVLRRRDHRLGHPAPDAGRPDPGPAGEVRRCDSARYAALYKSFAGVVRPQRAAVAAVPGLLERRADRRHGDQHLGCPGLGHVARLRRRCRTRWRCSSRPSCSPTSSGTGWARRPRGARSSTTPCCRSATSSRRSPTRGWPWWCRYLFGVVWHLFPTSGGYDEGLLPRVLDVHLLPARPLVPAVPHRVPGEPRRLGHRHAQPGHLRARERLLPLPARPRRQASAWSAGTPTGTRRCRSCPGSRWRSAWSSAATSSPRSRSTTPASAPDLQARSRARTTSCCRASSSSSSSASCSRTSSSTWCTSRVDPRTRLSMQGAAA